MPSVIVDRTVESIKSAWHRDLVSNPETHAWVLSLYRAGELYPDTVDDYFPVELAPWPWLAEAMAKHRDDEHRHGGMFARAIKLSGHPIEEFSGDDVYNHVIRSCTATRWRAEPSDGPDARRLQLAHFLAHAHHLERRVAHSLELHLEACERGGADVASKVVSAVAADEHRHIGYTLDAVRELVGESTARAVIAHHRRAEARADLLFSERQVRRFLERFGARASTSRRGLYTLCATLQRAAARLA